ncbi:MAG: DNA-methyltransferase [Blastopirellula sp. JB062]
MRTIYNRRATKLIAGDALTVLPKLAAKGERFHAVISDPPYSSGGLHASARRQATSAKYQQTGAKLHPNFFGDNRDQRSYLAWSTIWLSHCFELLADRGVVALFIDWRNLPVMSDAIQAAGFVWQGVAVWDKQQSRPRLGGFRQQAEFIVWGSKGKLSTVAGAKCIPGVFHHNYVRGGQRVHAAQKPVDLMDEICQVVSDREKPRILDPFAGSASTLIAARRCGFSSVGVEQCETIAATAADRLRAATLAPLQAA